MNQTIFKIFLEKAGQLKNRSFLKFKKEGAWQDLTWKEVEFAAKGLAISLIKLGIRPQERIAILSENRPEWAISDLAILGIGAVSVPIYPSDIPSQIEFILKDSQSKIIIVSSLEQLKKVAKIWHDLKELRFAIVISGPKSYDNPAIINFYELLKKGQEDLRKDTSILDQRLQAQRESDIASIIYTSGTTGLPKGVMLSHENFLSNCIACAKLFKITEDDMYLSFLPLSHVFERTAGFFFMMLFGATICYAEDIYTVSENMKEVQPTIMCGVPRFFEKAYGRILEGAVRLPFHKKHTFFWACNIGKAYLKKNKALPLLALQYKMARRLVFDRLKSRLAKSLKFFICGGAPLSAQILEFFWSVGLPIYEGYGLTETSPVITLNSPKSFKLESVGKAIPEVEVRIAPDGEILAKGPNLMQGYLNRDDLTKEAIKDGWLHTGDIGFMDEEKFLFITDRKKDIIVTAGGKNIAPSKIENLLKTDRYTTEAMVYGEGKKYLTALIVPDFERLKGYARFKSIDYESMSSLVKDKRIYDFFMMRINKILKKLPRYEQIKYFSILDRGFEQEKCEITPTLKIRRKIICEEYKELLESMYKDISVNVSKS